MKTYQISQSTHPTLFALLNLTEKFDCDIVLDDDEITIHLGDLIDSAKEELLGE